MSGNVPHPQEKDPLRLNRAVRDLFEGRSNAYGTFTCTTGAATTTVSQPNVGGESVIILSPMHANAASEMGAGTIYVAQADISAGQFVVHHANNATANRTFAYAIVG